MKTNSTLTMNEHPLKAFIDAACDDAPDATAADAAQRRLMHRLDQAAQAKAAKSAPWILLRGWRMPAATAAVLAILMMPLLMTVPGSDSVA